MPKGSGKKKFLKAYENISINELLMLELFETNEDERRRKEDEILENLIMVHAAAQCSRYSVPFIHHIVPKSHTFLTNVLPNLDDEGFKQFARLDRKTFLYLLTRIEDDPVFEGARGGKQFPVQTQLLLVLYRLGSSGEGATIPKISSLFGVSDGGTIQVITQRVFHAIKKIQRQFLFWPNANERKQIVLKSFHELPYCIGYIDGTEIKLAEKPLEDSEAYFSRKQNYSMKLQVVCDSELKVRHMVIGYPGSVHDARIYNECDLARRPNEFFDNNQWIAGDSAYNLSATVLTPFRANRLQGAEQEPKFNKTFSQHRVRVEHCIGQLKERFGSLKELKLQIKSDECVAKANVWILVCGIVHNIAIEQKEVWNLSTIDANTDETDNYINSEFSAASEGEIKRREIMQLMNL